MGLFRRPGKGRKDAEEDGHLPPGRRRSSSIKPLMQKLGGDSSDEDDDSIPHVDEAVQIKAQLVMKDHLGIMRDIVMKIRHEEGYAKSMYANCPRLQHLLDRNPDLRPVFEDPKLVRINFETVYKEAGGILPEDEEAEEAKKKKPSLLVRIANHPIFKALKVIIFLKKIVGCILGGGIALLTGCYLCCVDSCTECCCEDALEEIGEAQDSGEKEGGENDDWLDPETEMDENQRALNSAADYMEDPDVQEQMQRLLEDPENLEDAIENDAELRALRDSNPLCAELMQDPETMKILTDPDNLRALGEAPNLIQMDFADPTGFTPEVDFVDAEVGDLEGMDAMSDYLSDLGASGSIDGLEAFEGGDFDNENNLFDFDDEMEHDDDIDDIDTGIDSFGLETTQEGFLDEMMVGDETAADEDLLGLGGEAEGPSAEVPAEAALETDGGGGGWEDDFALEDQGDGDAGPGDAEAANKGKGGKAQAKTENKSQQPEAAKKGGMSGIISSLGVAATDVIASQIVGGIFGELPMDMFGSGDVGPDLGGIEDAADQADDLIDDNLEDMGEDMMEDLDDGKSSDEEKKQNNKGGHRRASLEDHRGEYVFDAEGRKSYLTMDAALRGLKVDDGEDSIDDGLRSINSQDDEEDEKDGFEDEDDIEDGGDDENGNSKQRSSGVFGAFKSLASATVTTAKESLLSNLLGDDLAEMLVEKQEEMGEDDSDEGGKNDDENGEKEKKKRSSLRNLLGRRSSSRGGSGDDTEAVPGEEEEADEKKPRSSVRRSLRGLFRRGSKIEEGDSQDEYEFEREFRSGAYRDDDDDDDDDDGSIDEGDLEHDHGSTPYNRRYDDSYV